MMQGFLLSEIDTKVARADGRQLMIIEFDAEDLLHRATLAS